MNQALASLNVVKIMMAENVVVTGQVASTFEEIGIKESELVLSKYIDRIQLGQNGVIVVELSALIDDQRYLKLKPVVRTASYQLEWDCRI